MPTAGTENGNERMLAGVGLLSQNINLTMDMSSQFTLLDSPSLYYLVCCT